MNGLLDFACGDAHEDVFQTERLLGEADDWATRREEGAHEWRNVFICAVELNDKLKRRVDIHLLDGWMLHQFQANLFRVSQNADGDGDERIRHDERWRCCGTAFRWRWGCHGSGGETVLCGAFHQMVERAGCEQPALFDNDGTVADVL